jgi:hypothetical protein
MGINNIVYPDNPHEPKGRTWRTRLYYPFFDIEGCILEECEATLKEIQSMYNLSDIYITSDHEKSFHGFCFSPVKWKVYLQMLLYCEHLDYQFFYWTVRRSKATLRLSMKTGRDEGKIIKVLKSYSVPFPTRLEKKIYDTGIEKKGIWLVYVR